MKANQERMEALMDVSLETTKVCLEKTEVNQGKAETKMESVSRRDKSGDYQSTREPTGGPATSRGIPEPTEKADQGQCIWKP
jgi:hypothetical protein